MPLAGQALQQFDGHGVQHFVANEHGVHLLRQGLHPLHLCAEGGQPRLLTRLQAAREVHDDVAAQFHALRFQGREHLFGQGAGASAELPHLGGAGGLQRLGHLASEGAAKVG